MSVPLNDITDDYARRVERERRRREDELLIILLALMGTARVRATDAAVDGFDVVTAIRNTIVGISNRPGAIPDIAKTMAKAHGDGFRRVALTAGVRSVTRADAGTLAALIELYTPQARAAAVAMAESLIERVRAALFNRGPDTTIRTAVAGAFDTDGFSRTNATAIDLATERAVVTAHNGGVFSAVRGRPDLEVTGLAHITINDGRETDICHDRIGLVLRVDDPYWLTNAPQLHWRCRSTIQPRFGDVQFSEWRPTVPPMPGFGRGPLPPFARAA